MQTQEKNVADAVLRVASAEESAVKALREAEGGALDGASVYAGQLTSAIETVSRVLASVSAAVTAGATAHGVKTVDALSVRNVAWKRLGEADRVVGVLVFGAYGKKFPFRLALDAAHLVAELVRAARDVLVPQGSPLVACPHTAALAELEAFYREAPAAAATTTLPAPAHDPPWAPYRSAILRCVETMRSDAASNRKTMMRCSTRSDVCPATESGNDVSVKVDPMPWAGMEVTAYYACSDKGHGKVAIIVDADWKNAGPAAAVRTALDALVRVVGEV